MCGIFRAKCSFIHRVVIIKKYTTTRYMRAVDWYVAGTHFAEHFEHIYYVQRIGHISWQRSLQIFIVNMLVAMSENNKLIQPYAYGSNEYNDIFCNIRRVRIELRHCWTLSTTTDRRVIRVVRVRCVFTMMIFTIVLRTDYGRKKADETHWSRVCIINKFD